MPHWVNDAYETYRRRLGADMPLELVEIATKKRSKHADITRLIEHEGEAMLKATKAHDRIIALDVQGKRLSTETLAAQLSHWQHDGRNLCLMIGGADGLAPAVLKRAEQRWSLSDLTLPHPLVRVVVAEQLYRCWTVNQGHPYHRGE